MIPGLFKGVARGEWRGNHVGVDLLAIAIDVHMNAVLGDIMRSFIASLPVVHYRWFCQYAILECSGKPKRIADSEPVAHFDGGYAVLDCQVDDFEVFLSDSP